jgi:hypothetical protein
LVEDICKILEIMNIAVDPEAPLTCALPGLK